MPTFNCGQLRTLVKLSSYSNCGQLRTVRKVPPFLRLIKRRNTPEAVTVDRPLEERRPEEAQGRRMKTDIGRATSISTRVHELEAPALGAFETEPFTMRMEPTRPPPRRDAASEDDPSLDEATGGHVRLPVLVALEVGRNRRNKKESKSNHDDDAIMRKSSSVVMSQPRRCGEACQWRPRLIVLAITAGLGLSTVSSLDCRLVDLSLGDGIGRGGNGRPPSGIGLWSLSGPNGRCLSYQDARERAPSTAPRGTGADDDFILADGDGDGGGITTEEAEDTNNYSNWLVNGDISWSLCRMMAILGAAFGLFAT
ncbi:hypothetical protein THAOC_25920, partial [Thalassiosira oceanica]